MWCSGLLSSFPSPPLPLSFLTFPFPSSSFFFPLQLFHFCASSPFLLLYFFSGPLSSSFLQTFHFPVSSFRLSQFPVSTSLLFPFLFQLSLLDSSYVLCCFDEVSILSDSAGFCHQQSCTLPTHRINPVIEVLGSMFLLLYNLKN